jgi:hypothetical protein
MDARALFRVVDLQYLPRAVYHGIAAFGVFLRMKKARTMKRFSVTIIRMVTAALALIALFSCAQIEKAKDTASIKDRVMSYNKGLADASRTGDMKPLDGIASEDVLKKLYYWLGAWADSDVYMDGTLKDLQFKKVAIAGQSAKALTAEDWVYEYRNIKTRQAVLPAAGSFYEMEYMLQKKDSKWIITAINIKSEEKKDVHE